MYSLWLDTFSFLKFFLQVSFSSSFVSVTSSVISHTCNKIKTILATSYIIMNRLQISTLVTSVCLVLIVQFLMWLTHSTVLRYIHRVALGYLKFSRTLCICFPWISLQLEQGCKCCLNHKSRAYFGSNHESPQHSKFIFFLSGHLATDCSSLVTSEKF